jgi:beta-lactamase regulating signal transducer with metallopeptidase domain
MIAWMIYCVIVGALIAVAARAAEWIARNAGVSVRWCWAIAMAALVALAAIAPTRQSTIRELPVIPNSIATRVDAIPLQAGIEAVSRGLPSSSALIATVAWSLASALLLVVILGVHARVRHARHAWPLAEMHGARVRVAPDVGPVVIGFRVPEIVVPRWLLGRTHEEQRLIVTHEAEHVRAKDTLLLGAGVVAAAAMPWNPFVWYMFSRLRLAVEVDCDARVLARGATVESYGSLLIDVASHAVPLRFVVPALANSPSHLHERIIAMKHIVPKYARLRAGVIAVLGATALLAACEAKMPTSAEVEAMDASTAERRLAVMIPDKDSVREYLVDSKVVTREQAFAVKADDVTEVNVARLPSGVAQLRIRTRGGLAEERVALLKDDASQGAGAVRRIARTTGPLLETPLKGTPMIFIDGVRSSLATLSALDRTTITSIDVLKGSALREEYPGFTADELANGLIRVVTKK